MRLKFKRENGEWLAEDRYSFYRVSWENPVLLKLEFKDKLKKAEGWRFVKYASQLPNLKAAANSHSIIAEATARGAEKIARRGAGRLMAFAS